MNSLLIENPDYEWEEFGRNDPYYGVLSFDVYRSTNLTPEVLQKFFATGERDITHIMQTIHANLDAHFTPAAALDFGCGVGRLSLPLAKRSTRLVGVDISPAMLVEARKNCERYGVDNATFVLSDDELSQVTGSFDLIVSSIVFQHIPAERGMKILEQLLAHLQEGGYMAVQLITGGSTRRTVRWALWLRRHVPGAKAILNLLRGRKAGAPAMQMNPYDLNRVFSLLEKNGASQVFARLGIMGEYPSVFLFCRKDHQAQE